MEKVQVWRRSYDVPRLRSAGTIRCFRARILATLLEPKDSLLPMPERPVARFLPYWHKTIAPCEEGKRVLIAATEQPASAREVSRQHTDEVIPAEHPTGSRSFMTERRLTPIRTTILVILKRKEATQAVANQLKK